MIAFKEGDCVYFASPMKYQNFFTQARVDYTFEENGDIWHLNDGKGTIVMAAAKSSRLVDILRYSDVFACEFSYEGMKSIIENIKNCVKGTNCFTEGDRLGVTLVVAQGDRAFEITTHGSVFEMDRFLCCDESDERMLAVYEYCKNIPDAHERIRTIYTNINEIGLSQMFPVAVINTRDDTYTLLTQS